MRERMDRPQVQVPGDTSEKPVWTKVGVIAVIGFLIGIGWPKLAGYQLGPTPPQDEKTTAKADLTTGESSPKATQNDSKGAPFQGTAAASAQPATPTPVQVQTVVVKHTNVLSCRDSKNKAVDDCDRPDLDVVLMPLIKNLEKCSASAGLAGKLSIGFDVDFERNRVQALQGKSTTIPAETVQGLWSCVGEGVKRLRIRSMRHDQRRYTLFYSAFFYPPGKLVDGDGADDPPRRDTRQSEPKAVDQAESGAQNQGGQEVEKPIGSATIVYDTAVVRDAPKTGNVISRLVRGTRVEMLEKKESWYRIRFEGREGWIYRGALAM